MKLHNLLIVCAMVFGSLGAYADGVVSNTGSAIGGAVSDVGYAVGDAADATATATADTAITTQVKTKLAAESTDFLEVSVTTTDGVVYLSGVVNNEQEANQVAQIAGSVDGVKSVDTSELSYANK